MTTARTAAQGRFSLTVDGADLPADRSFDVINPSTGRVNSHGGVQMHLPFGGHKWSGIGVENCPWGLYGFTEIQVIAALSRKHA